MFERCKTGWESAAAGAVALALLLGPASARAQEEEVVEEPQSFNTGNVSLSLGTDFTTHYFFRGALQEDQGFIAQPWGEVGIAVTEELSLSAGIWNSFHDEQTGAMTDADGPDSWYESDLYVGASLALFENFEAGVTYIAYTSPNDAFDTIQEIDLSFAYDDSAWWGESGFALSPSLTLAFEVDNTLLGTDEGTWLGLGVEPSFTLIESEDYPVTLSVPVTVGLSLDNYYEDASDEDDNFGFVDVGLVLGMPLAFITPEYGAWDMSMGVHFLFLGDTNEQLNNGDDFEAVGTIGFSMAY